MDELTFVRDLGKDVGAPSPAKLAAARAALMLEIERAAAEARPVDIASRPARAGGRPEQDTVAPVTPLEKRPRRGARVGRALLAAAAVLAVAGASFGAVKLFGALNSDREAAPVPTVTATPTPRPSPTPTPAPTPDPTTPPPTADPAAPSGDMSTWQITEAGIGPFTLGMSWGEAIEKVVELGGTTSQSGQPGFCGQLWVVQGDVSVVAFTEDGSRVTAVRTQFSTVDITSVTAPTTADGITLLSTADAVRARYPDAVENRTDVAGAFLTVNLADSRIHFGYETEEGGAIAAPGHIHVIEVNQLEILPYEHCEPTVSGALTVTENGVGPFWLGMPWADAVAQARTLGWRWVSSTCRPMLGMYDALEGVTVVQSRDGATVGEVVVSPTWGHPDVVIATAEGITASSTQEEVRSAYGDAQQGIWTIGDGSQKPYLRVDADGDGSGFWVVLADGSPTRAVEIRISAAAELEALCPSA